MQEGKKGGFINKVVAHVRANGGILRGDKVFWLIYFLFVLISIVEVFSASSMTAYAGNMYAPIGKHLFIVLISTFVAIVVSHLPWSLIKKSTFYIYAAALLALVLTLTIGTEANDAQRSFSVFGIPIQASEVLKPAIVFIAAFFLGANHQLTPSQAFWAFWAFCGIPTFIIFFESGSTALIIAIISYLICWISNAPKRLMRKITLIAVAHGVGFFLILSLPSSVLQHIGRATTWKSRIYGNSTGMSDTIHNQLSEAEKDSLYFVIDGPNYQKKHAKIAIAQGGLSPVGVLPGNSKARDYLPEAHNDFIYAIIIEELGLIGVFIVPFLYLFYYFRIAVWGKRARHKQQRLLLYGMGLLFVFQAFLNMGVATATAPLMGQTLPLISTGGSSYLFSAMSFGLVIAVAGAVTKEREELKQRSLQATEENSLQETREGEDTHAQRQEAENNQ